MTAAGPRLPPLAPGEWDDVLRRVLENSPGGTDEPMHIFTTLGRADPELFRRWLGFGGALLGGTLPGRLRELVILRTAARFAQHWNFVGGTPEQFRHKRDVLHQHCADVGRDPAEILLSSHVQFTGDPAESAATAAALGEAGVQLAIVTMRPPHTVAALESLAQELSQLA